ncbi:putative Molybdopterin cofactor synthesis protein A [Magnetospirillum sp. LM-5]|uniref:radical SAM/SPASM domain-containing protein n=1 Tax=Magnetospirillum sp. LM-5 TaxID=2681466 RepID=UPI00138230BD|nr:radical SAM protein [Magnetospirillum sp. LM-5]CAA7615916.1 putative Molybdopterin cofactor synthesis protein A [Magnetospirillum sp. LM-5]
MQLESVEHPTIVRIELTNQCNLSCPHCRHHALEKKQTGNYHEYYRSEIQMTHEQVDSLVDEIAEWRPSVTLNVANEPLVATTFRHAAERVKQKGLAGTFNTNGLLIDEDLARFLVDIGFDSVNVSVDAATPETLKKARGFARLDKLVEKVELLLKVRGAKPLPRVGVTFVETDYNYQEIPAFLEFWKSRVDLIRVTGYIQDLRPDIERINPTLHRDMLPERIPCKQLFRDIVIRANGDVTPCVVTSEQPDIVVGNIFRDGGVRAVWNSPRFRELRELHNAGRWDETGFCKNCDYWVETQGYTEAVKDGFLIRTPSPYTTFYNVLDRLGSWNRDLHDRQGMGKG